MANAKGWNSSALEAILRNTALYLLRRNLMGDENNQTRDGKYIFISGMSYGWKQWVSTGIYSALGLNDPEAMVESQRAVFWTRMDYEENAQYYLIWAALAKRAGGTVNEALIRQAYEFIRRHEKEGAMFHRRSRVRRIPRAGKPTWTCCPTTMTTRRQAIRASIAAPWRR